jgi:hypothetical protein
LNLLEKYKPGVSRRTLLFISGAVWTIAGGILFTRGLVSLLKISNNLYLSLLIGLVGGILFYLLLFKRISAKYSNRIINLSIENPCAFSFFNLRSYIMMASMITGGILIKTYAPIDKIYIFTFFIVMSVPLLLAAARFFIAGFSTNWFNP